MSGRRGDVGSASIPLSGPKGRREPVSLAGKVSSPVAMVLQHDGLTELDLSDLPRVEMSDEISIVP